MMPQIGDFLTIALLAAKVFNALDSCRGSKSEFRVLLGTLKSFSQAMFQAEALCMDWQMSPGRTAKPSQQQAGKAGMDHIDVVVQEILEETQKCKALFAQFQRKFAAYEKTFESSAKGRISARGTFKKLTWLGDKDLADRFEKELQAHLQAVQVRLSVFYSLLLKKDLGENKALLQSVGDSMSGLSLGINNIGGQMSQALARLDLIHSSMPIGLGYGWGPEQPIVLLDALGRTTRLPVMLVASPDTFRDILMIMHRNHPGQDKIKSGKYVVSDEDSGGTLVLREKWVDSIQPGRQIGVSFILDYPQGEDELRCPRCKTSSTWPDVVPNKRRCKLCHLVYKIEDREQSKLYWTDLRKLPKLPRNGAVNGGQPAKLKKSEAKAPGAPKRVKTLDPEDFAHPYSRVHYQRKVPRPQTREQIWHQPSPEFEGFLNALPPVHRAATVGDLETLDDLLEGGADPNAGWDEPDDLHRHDRTGFDFIGAPPIHFAAYWGKISSILYLLSKGASIEGKDAAGTTALHAAAWTGNEKVFQTLLRKGADRHVCDYDGWSVQVYAMAQGNDNIARLLLEDTAGADSSNGDGISAQELVESFTVRLAAKMGNQDVVLRMLLENQSRSPDPQPSELLLTEALVGAAEGGHEELVRILLEQGADASRPDQYGSTALHWAAWGGHAEVESQMYDADCDDRNALSQQRHHHNNTKNDEDSDSGCEADAESGTGAPLTPTHTGRDREMSACHEGVMRLLLAGGADVNTQNRQGCVPLHWVAGAGSVPIMRFLIGEGARADVKDGRGITPVDRARETGDKGAVAVLLES